MNKNWRDKLNYFLSPDFLYAGFKVFLVFLALGLIQYGVYIKLYGDKNKSSINKNNKSKNALSLLLDQALQTGDFSKVDQYTKNQHKNREQIINAFGGRRRIASENISCDQKIDHLETRIEKLEAALRKQQNRGY